MKKKVKATEKQMTSQMITSGVLNFISYMPNPDDVASGTWDSYGTYRKMKTDPRIKSLLGKKKTAALLFPLSIKQESSSDAIFDFVKDLELFKNIYRKEKRMLTALDYGFSVSELIWKKQGNKFLPDNIITRKPERFVFNKNWELFLSDFGSKIPLNQSYKWLIFHHDPDDENPYGTSDLRCVYWAYMFKQAGYDFWLQATEKFSVTTLLALFKADGDEETIRARAFEIAQMLMGVQSGSAAAVANADTIQNVNMAGDLSHFKELTEACDIQISYGLTGQSIATSNTNGGSLALGEVQADLFYEDCKGIALELQSVLQKVIDWTVEINFGPGEKSPLIQFDVKRRATFEQIMQAIDRGIPLSKSALYSDYALPEPKDDDDTFIQQTPQTMLLSDSDKGLKKNFQFC